MKIVTLKQSVSALAFVGLTGVLALLIDTYSAPVVEDVPEELMLNQQEVLNRALNDLKIEPFQMIDDEQKPLLIKIYNSDDQLVEHFESTESPDLLSSILKRKATFLSEYNNTAIYKIMQ